MTLDESSACAAQQNMTFHFRLGSMLLKKGS
jgi:hypothetical protein